MEITREQIREAAAQVANVQFEYSGNPYSGARKIAGQLEGEIEQYLYEVGTGTRRIHDHVFNERFNQSLDEGLADLLSEGDMTLSESIAGVLVDIAVDAMVFENHSATDKVVINSVYEHFTFQPIMK